MRVVVLSDTHGKHRELSPLPEADLVVHAGDFATIGTEAEVLDFLNWFCDLPHRHKVFVCGNHDEPLLSGRVSGLPNNCHQLNFSSMVIEEKIAGFPFFIEREGNSGYQKAIEYEEEGVDIVVSHQPPYGILDGDLLYGHLGSPTLLMKVKNWQPKFHLFGHIHEASGRRDEGGTTFINSAQIRNEVVTPLLPPIVIEL